MPITPPINYSKALPSFWTEDDKLDYDELTAEAKRRYKDFNDFVIHVAVVAWINDKKGLRQKASEEEIKKEMEKYDNTTLVLETPVDENFKMEDTMINKGTVLENNLTNIIEEQNEIL